MTRETFEAPVDGGVLAGYVDGEGPPVLVLHGGPGLTVSIVDGLVADLLPAYRVATFQQRGIEPSTTEGEFTIDEAVADVGAVLDHLGWDRAYVVGSSWGGHLAFWCAAQVPRSAARRPRRRPARCRRRRRQRRVRGRDGAADAGGGPGARGRAGPAGAGGGGVGGARAGEPATVLAGLLRRTGSGVADVGERLSIPAYSGLFTDLLARLPELEASLPSIAVPVGRRRRGATARCRSAAAQAVADRVPGGWTAGRRPGPDTSRGTRCRARCVRRWTD